MELAPDEQVSYRRDFLVFSGGGNERRLVWCKSKQLQSNDSFMLSLLLTGISTGFGSSRNYSRRLLPSPCWSEYGSQPIARNLLQCELHRCLPHLPFAVCGIRHRIRRQQPHARAFWPERRGVACSPLPFGAVPDLLVPSSLSRYGTFCPHPIGVVFGVSFDSH